MSRPTTDKKGNTVILRINDEMRRYLEEKSNGETISSYVRKMIENEQNGVSNNVIQNPLSNELVGQIDYMCSFFKIDAETFLKEVCKGLETGEIGYENGLKTYGTLDTSRFENACHDKGIDAEKMLEKATQMVWKS